MAKSPHCAERTHHSKAASMFSLLLSLMLKALKMAKSPHCAERTHHSKAALRLNVLYICSVSTVAGIWDLKEYA